MNNRIEWTDFAISILRPAQTHYMYEIKYETRSSSGFHPLPPEYYVSTFEDEFFINKFTDFYKFIWVIIKFFFSRWFHSGKSAAEFSLWFSEMLKKVVFLYYSFLDSFPLRCTPVEHKPSDPFSPLISRWLFLEFKEVNLEDNPLYKLCPHLICFRCVKPLVLLAVFSYLFRTLPIPRLLKVFYSKKGHNATPLTSHVVFSDSKPQVASGGFSLQDVNNIDGFNLLAKLKKVEVHCCRTGTFILFFSIF